MPGTCYRAMINTAVLEAAFAPEIRRAGHLEGFAEGEHAEIGGVSAVDAQSQL